MTRARAAVESAVEVLGGVRRPKPCSLNLTILLIELSLCIWFRRFRAETAWTH